MYDALHYRDEERATGYRFSLHGVEVRGQCCELARYFQLC